MRILTGKLVLVVLFMATAAEATRPYSELNTYAWNTTQVINEIIFEINEHHRVYLDSIGQPPEDYMDEVTNGQIVQWVDLWSNMQMWIYGHASDFLSTNPVNFTCGGDWDQPNRFDFYSFEELGVKAGVTSRFRRMPGTNFFHYLTNDWTDPGDTMYLQSGSSIMQDDDVIGPWIPDDIQLFLSLMDTVLYNDSISSRCGGLSNLRTKVMSVTSNAAWGQSWTDAVESLHQQFDALSWTVGTNTDLYRKYQYAEHSSFAGGGYCSDRTRVDLTRDIADYVFTNSLAGLTNLTADWWFLVDMDDYTALTTTNCGETNAFSCIDAGHLISQGTNTFDYINLDPPAPATTNLSQYDILWANDTAGTNGQVYFLTAYDADIVTISNYNGYVEGDNPHECDITPGWTLYKTGFLAVAHQSYKGGADRGFVKKISGWTYSR